MNPYSIFDLGFIPSLGLSWVRPRAVSNKGVAVGNLNAIDSSAAIRHDGSWEALPSPFLISGAMGINNSSASEIIVGQAGSKAALWIDGEYVDLPEQLSVDSSYAADVNDKGVAVGVADGRPFRFDTATQEVHILSVSGHSKRAFAINADGKVVGWTSPSGGLEGAAFLFDSTAHLLPTLGPIPSGLKLDINDDDFVVGSYVYGPQGTTHAFIYSHETQDSIDIHPPGDIASSIANAINNRNQVVGAVQYGPRNQVLATIWTVEDGTLDLRDLLDDPDDWELIEATDINDKGQIVGWGTHFGQPRGFLMTPIESASGLSAGEFAMRVKVVMSAGGAIGFRVGGDILYFKGPPIGPGGPLELAQRDALIGLAIQTLARDISDLGARRVAEHGGIEVVRMAAERGRSGDYTNGRKSSWLSRLLRKIVVWLER